jgi:hypothetical protein
MAKNIHEISTHVHHSCYNFEVVLDSFRIYIHYQDIPISNVLKLNSSLKKDLVAILIKVLVALNHGLILVNKCFMIQLFYVFSLFLQH